MNLANPGHYYGGGGAGVRAPEGSRGALSSAVQAAVRGVAQGQGQGQGVGSTSPLRSVLSPPARRRARYVRGF